MIVVIGSWRSGTSAATRMLEAAGLKLGARVEKHAEHMRLMKICHLYINEPLRTWKVGQPSLQIESHEHLAAMNEILAVLQELEEAGIQAVKHPAIAHLWRYLPARYRFLQVCRSRDDVITSMIRGNWWRGSRGSSEYRAFLVQAIADYESVPKPSDIDPDRTMTFNYTQFKNSDDRHRREVVLELFTWATGKTPRRTELDAMIGVVR